MIKGWLYLANNNFVYVLNDGSFQGVFNCFKEIENKPLPTRLVSYLQKLRLDSCTIIENGMEIKDVYSHSEFQQKFNLN